jgi:hypothetical protein
MSWHWSRLSTLTFLALLYASPLSSGDKGLWLSVASMPVQPFEAIPGKMPPEHSILLPARGGLVLALVRVERSEPSLGPALLAIDEATVDAAWTPVSRPSSWSTRDAISLVSAVPRGPPA